MNYDAGNIYILGTYIQNAYIDSLALLRHGTTRLRMSMLYVPSTTFHPRRICSLHLV